MIELDFDNNNNRVSLLSVQDIQMTTRKVRWKKAASKENHNEKNFSQIHSREEIFTSLGL